MLDDRSLQTDNDSERSSVKYGMTNLICKYKIYYFIVNFDKKKRLDNTQIEKKKNPEHGFSIFFFYIIIRATNEDPFVKLSNICRVFFKNLSA